MVSSQGRKEGLRFVVDESEAVELMVESDALSFIVRKQTGLLGKEGQWFRSNNEGHEEHLHHRTPTPTPLSGTVDTDRGSSSSYHGGGLQTFYRRRE